MSINTLDDVIAGMRPLVKYMKVVAAVEAAGVLHSLLYTPGFPGAAAAPSPGLAGSALTGLAGGLGWTNPVSGNSYLARFSASANLVGGCVLYDRLWHNSGLVVTTTGAQAVSSVAWPARDNNGSVNGEGVMVALEVSTATTNAGVIANTTMSYTNQAGTAGRTATMTSFPATAVAGTWVPFELQAGDTGVRSIQSVTLGTSRVTGALHLVAYRELAWVDINEPNVGGAVDAVTSGFPRLYNDTVPCLLWMPSATTAFNVQGQFGYTQG